MYGIEVESVEATKPNTTEAQVTITITNPQEVEITGITIEDMEVTITRNVTQNGITSITVRATPNRYYDSYKLTEIKYKTSNSDEEYIKEVETEIEVQFYKEIYTYEDWQSIEEGTYQNYRLMADIDFSGRDTINSNITVNRLEAENNVYTLKNITLEFSTANTGLIQNVKTSMKNIGFENIILTNTASSGSYFGVISYNNGNLENLKFKDITITATSISYVGVIGSETSGNIKNIELDNVEIKAANYVGGLIGNINVASEVEISNITGNEINVEASGNYVGGIIGYQIGDNMQITELLIQNSNISGNNNTGGIIGYAYNGNLTYLTANSANVTGNSYVGGIVGCNFDSTSNSTHLFQYISINDSTIIGSGNYIGGINGYLYHRSCNYWYLNNINIQAPSVNSQYIGGAVGMGFWSYLYRVQIEGLEIDSNGTNVGGIVGGNRTDSLVFVSNSYINNGVIKGSSNVGGIIGDSQYLRMEYIYANVEVEATNHTAGGIIGYMDNTNMTASRYFTKILYTMLLDSTVSAPTNAGGLIGNIAIEIYRATSFYYNNYIDADITSEDETTSSLIIGGRPDENDYITNTYVYKYSTLNGEYVYQTDDNIDESQYLVRSDLEQQTTYTSKIGLGTTYFSYTRLAEGKYPTIADSYLYYPDLQEGVDLPTDPDISSLSQVNDENNGENGSESSGINTLGINTLGANTETSETEENSETDIEITVYPVSVNEINIDFSNVPTTSTSSESSTSGTSGTNNSSSTTSTNNTTSASSETNTSTSIYFTYYLNGVAQEEISLTQKTYTIPYNYQDELEIQVYSKEKQTTASSTADTESVETTNLASLVASPEELKSTISLVGDTNAYLNGTTLYINGEAQEGEYVNLYSGYALTTQGQILNIETKTIETTTSSTDTSTEAKPLHTYTYGSYTIQTYGTYSTINGNIKTQIYNVRNGKLSAISNSLDLKIDNYITDSYNGKEYQTILTNDGKLENIKEEIQLPENFNNSNITQLVQNQDKEKTEAMVIYETGKVIVFNYVTGEIIYDNGISTNQSLLAYIQESISNIWSDYENMQIEYENTQELIAKLKEMPVEKALELASTTQTENEENTSSTDSTENSSQTSRKQPNNKWRKHSK